MSKSTNSFRNVMQLVVLHLRDPSAMIMKRSHSHILMGNYVLGTSK